MGISFVEAKTNLENLQKDYQDFHDEVWKDSETYNISAESLKVAVETMRKYEKIEQIIEDWERDKGWALEMSELYWLDRIKEVIEDGNND